MEANPNTKMFDQQTMQNLLRGGTRTPEGYKIVSDTICDHSRWSIQFELIFTEPGQPEGEAWQTSYSRGATESQDERPFEYDTDGVEAFRVKLVEQMVKVWVPA